ncbi:hypothetical protein D9756_005662 [Leucocoprinus leucothites]|uniref:Uncharacterized protein n=1 Tax=Leucocoprinus leucothites TaxID=201217 RepID=A0A8H5D841_9AGAR|nr:hypothetical protein D9756_005662 [Leucoagaricus leucothites]
MPRTRNVTREQWQAAVSPSGDTGASAIRPLGSTLTQHQPKTSRSSFEYASGVADSSSKENRGYDREHDDNHDENEDENVPPVVDREGKGKGKAKEEIPTGRKRKPQPLQDITDLVVSHGNRPSDTEDTPRGGRRVKRRRRERTIPSARPISPSPVINRAAVTRRPFTSSLPPSSPPPPASFELQTSSALQRNEIWDDVMPEEQEDLPLASDDPVPARNSDPFGFFAVERELKAQRNWDHEPGPSTGLREAGELVLVPATSPPPLQLDITAVLDDSGGEEEYVSPCATPQTPHKKKRRQTISGLGKGKEREDLLYSPRTESAPSSPSPLKAREPRMRAKPFQPPSDFVEVTAGPYDGDHGEGRSATDESEGNETAKETPPRRVLRSKTRTKQAEESTLLPGRKTGVRRQREDKSNTPSDPVALAQKLVDRLPKRRKKQVLQDEEPEEDKPRRSKRQRKTRTTKKAVKHEKPPKTKVEADEGRLAVREYFRKLEEYTLEEEKVYVI